MSNKRNTRAGTSRVETLTALPTVLVPKKKRNQFLKNSLKNQPRFLRSPSFPGLSGLSGSPSLPGLSGFPGFPGFPKNYREIN